MMRRISYIYIFILLFILPLKFGSVVSVGVQKIFPLSVWEWLLAVWPPFLLTPLSGAALLLALLTTSSQRSLYNPAGKSVFVWVFLLFFTLFGFCYTASLDFALLFFWHLLGVIALTFAVWLTVAARPVWSRRFLAALALGCLVTVLSGWQQVPGGGLRDTLEFAEESARNSGGEVSEDLLSKLKGERAFGTFVYPNSYAAHLILVGPLMVCFFAIAGRAVGRWMREEEILGKFFGEIKNWPIFTAAAGIGTGVILWGGALWFSGSRAALAALFAAVIFAAVCSLANRRAIILVAVSALLLGAISFALLQRGRDLDSVQARLDYWQAAAEMVQKRPLTGVGLGEFFHYYMRYKTADMEETRLPHNAFLFFASQAGLLAGFTYIMLIAGPLALLIRSRRYHRMGNRGLGNMESILAFAAGTGTLAWFIHSFFDFNITIPGSVAAMAVLSVLIFPPERPAAESIGKEEEGGIADNIRAFFLSPRSKLALFALALFCLAGIWRWPGQREYVKLASREVDLYTLPQFAEDVEAAAQLSPWAPQPWLLLGNRAEKLDAPTFAVRAFREAAVRSPHWAALWFDISRNELRVGNRAAARKAFVRGLTWYPQAPEVDQLRNAFPEIPDLRLLP